MTMDLLAGELRVLRSASAWLTHYCAKLSASIAVHPKQVKKRLRILCRWINGCGLRVLPNNSSLNTLEPVGWLYTSSTIQFHMQSGDNSEGIAMDESLFQCSTPDLTHTCKSGKNGEELSFLAFENLIKEYENGRNLACLDSWVTCY